MIKYFVAKHPDSYQTASLHNQLLLKARFSEKLLRKKLIQTGL
jgi:hypothetical protein